MSDERWPGFCHERMVIWHRGKDTTDVVCEKVESAFHSVKSFPLERIILQFWRPTDDAKLLSCSDTPYAFSLSNRRLRKYNLRSQLYSYAVVGNNVADDPMIIKYAPPTGAFFRRFPEVVLDLRAHSGTPLVDLALDCGLTCFMMLPLFSEASCIGVIEVSVRHPRHLLVIYNELNCGVKRVGLSIARPMPISMPFKAPPGDLKLARREVAEALKVATKSHDLTLAQVWIPYVTVQNRMSCSLLGRLWFSCLDKSDDMSRFYSDLLYLPLGNGPGLVARSIETRQPHLYRNIYKCTENVGIMAILSAHTKSTCFVICLRSSHTGDLNHIFEFYWPQQRNHFALMEALVLTLKQHLPSFRYENGAQLGEQLLVVDVDTSSSTTVEIFPDKKTSVGMKRKTRASTRMEKESLELNQYPLANFNNPKRQDDDDDDDDDLVILAVYIVDDRLFFLPSSQPTFESLMERIKQEFELNPSETYKIEYQVLPGEWHSLTDDTSLKTCIASYQASQDIDHIKLLVLPAEKE